MSELNDLSDRELLVKIATKQEEHFKKTNDHEMRVRSLEKSKYKIIGGISLAGGVGFWAWLKSYFIH